MVHYFTKYGSGECYFSSDLSSDSSSDEDDNFESTKSSLKISGATITNVSYCYKNWCYVYVVCFILVSVGLLLIIINH